MSKARKSTFWKVYRIILLVLLLIVIGVWILLWLFLNSYEKSQPDNVVNDIIKLFEKGDAKSLSKYVKLENKNINNTESIIPIINNNIRDGKYSYYVDTTNSTNKKMVYTINKNKQKFVKLTLSLDKRRRIFNGKIWKPSNIDKLIGEPSDITVSVPIDATETTINGYKLSDNELTINEFYPDELLPLKDYNVLTPLKKYTVKGIYGEPNIEVTYNNKVVNIISDNQDYIYPYELDQALLDSLRPTIEEFVKTYTRYAEDETGIASVNPYLISNSKASEFIKSALFYKGWVGNHTPTQFSEIELSGMQKYSDNAFKVVATYSYNFNASGNRKYDGKLTMYWVNQNGKWLLGNLNL